MGNVCGLRKFSSDFHLTGVTRSLMTTDMADLLRQSTASGTEFVGLPQLPWSGGTAVGKILNAGETIPWLRGPVVPRNLPASCHVVPELERQTMSRVKQVVATKIHVQLEGDKDIERARALKKLCDLILYVGRDSVVGRQILDAGQGSSSKEQLAQILSDCVARKSTSTLKTRSSSIAMYLNWLRDELGEGCTASFQESLVYRYLCNLRDRNAPATRASTLMESLRFCHHCLGFSGLNDTINSSRCLGVAHALYLKKAPTSQAVPFPPWMVGLFELAATYALDLRTKAEAGLILMGIHGRFRASDLKCIKAGALKPHLLECELLATKTSSRSAVKARSFLPGCVLRVGLLNTDWVREFLGARRRLGLPEVPGKQHVRDTNDTSFVMLPSAACVEGDVMGMSSTEITSAMHRILGHVLPHHTFSDFTSHSMKATWLSTYNQWENDYDTQCLLGYHMVKGRHSAVTYSRQALAIPMRRLDKMISEIRSGVFDPCAGPGALFPSTTAVKELKTQIENECGMNIGEIVAAFGGTLPETDPSSWSPLSAVSSEDLCAVSESEGEHEPERDHDEDASSSSCRSSSSSSESTDEATHAMIQSTHLGDRVRDVARHSALTMVFRHKSRRTLHYAHVEDDSKLACGRNKTSAFKQFTGDVELAWPKCKVCFGV